MIRKSLISLALISSILFAQSVYADITYITDTLVQVNDAVVKKITWMANSEGNTYGGLGSSYARTVVMVDGQKQEIVISFPNGFNQYYQDNKAAFDILTTAYTTKSKIYFEGSITDRQSSYIVVVPTRIGITGRLRWKQYRKMVK